MSFLILLSIVAESDSVVSVFKSRLYELQTTRSWDFMGATDHKSVFGNYSVDENYEVVVGHIDSGKSNIALIHIFEFLFRTSRKKKRRSITCQFFFLI